LLGRGIFCFELNEPFFVFKFPLFLNSFTGKNDAPMGAGENMKEAATRSFEHSKATVEEAARSAAEVVSDTAEAVKEKVKRSVSGGVTQPSEGSEEL